MWEDEASFFCALGVPKKFSGSITYRKMLTSALRALIKNPVKESFYGKKKKTINILTVFFIFHKSDVKIFLKWILNKCP